MRMLPLLALLCGCQEDILPATVIEHLQIVSIVSERPKIRLGESTDLIVTIADPDRLSPEVAVWICVPFGSQGRCLESELTGEAQPVYTGTRDPDTHAFVTTVVPLGIDVEEINAQLDEGGTFRGVLAFALACAPGACDLFDQLESGTVDPSHLSDPSHLLRGVPMSQAHAAWRTLTIIGEGSSGAPNPSLSVDFPDPFETQAGGSLDIRVGLDPSFSGRVFPMATVGGFTEDDIPTDAGSSAQTLTWLSREREAGRACHVYIIADDEEGGQAVQHASVSVR